MPYVTLTVAPLKQRPPGWEYAPTTVTPFRSTYSQTIDLLYRELDFLHASNPILQVDAEPGHFRVDGQLRADAKIRYPGVILSFDTRKHGTLVYPCNKFDGFGRHLGWQGNLRAIALGLEALRKVERYGIAERGQQYAGYAELGDGGIALGQGMTREVAATILAEAAGMEIPLGAPRRWAEIAYRRAVKTHHPDRGGEPAVFRKLTEARDLLVA